MPRYPRLALAEDAREFAHREFTVVEKREQAQARRLAAGAQRSDERIERVESPRRLPFEPPCAPALPYKHMLISFFAQTSRRPKPRTKPAGDKRDPPVAPPSAPRVVRMNVGNIDGRGRGCIAAALDPRLPFCPATGPVEASRAPLPPDAQFDSDAVPGVEAAFFAFGLKTQIDRAAEVEPHPQPVTPRAALLVAEAAIGRQHAVPDPVPVAEFRVQTQPPRAADRGRPPRRAVLPTDDRDRSPNRPTAARVQTTDPDRRTPATAAPNPKRPIPSHRPHEPPASGPAPPPTDPTAASIRDRRPTPTPRPSRRRRRPSDPPPRATASASPRPPAHTGGCLAPTDASAACPPTPPQSPLRCPPPNTASPPPSLSETASNRPPTAPGSTRPAPRPETRCRSSEPRNDPPPRRPRSRSRPCRSPACPTQATRPDPTTPHTGAPSSSGSREPLPIASSPLRSVYSISPSDHVAATPPRSLSPSGASTPTCAENSSPDQSSSGLSSDNDRRVPAAPTRPRPRNRNRRYRRRLRRLRPGPARTSGPPAPCATTVSPPASGSRVLRRHDRSSSRASCAPSRACARSACARDAPSPSPGPNSPDDPSPPPPRPPTWSATTPAAQTR